MVDVVGEPRNQNVEVLLFGVEVFEPEGLGQALVVELGKAASTIMREKPWEKLW